MFFQGKDVGGEVLTERPLGGERLLSRGLMGAVAAGFLVLMSCGPPSKPNHPQNNGEHSKWKDKGEGELVGKKPPAKPPKCPPSGGISLRPVVWKDGSGHLRWWNQERVLDKVKSTRQKPVEVCGVRGQLQWLLGVVCPNGAHPFKSFFAAHRSRLGSMGVGGRCGKTVDLYKVPCDTKVYQVYMDLYHCTESEVAQGSGPMGAGK